MFLDRDGTLIEDRHYLSDPEGVRLLPGAAEALARLNAAGIFAALVTNQSGIGRGLFGEPEYEAVHRRLVEALAEHGARVDAVYHCPLAPGDDDPEGMRKPGTGMHLRAAREHGLDVSRSWFVGDRLRDVVQAHALGGTAILIRGTEDEEEPAEAIGAIVVVDSFAEAVDVILSPAG